MALTEIEQKVLSALDEQGLIDALCELLRIKSLTGQEASAQRWLGKHMKRLGLDVDQWTIDMDTMRKHPQFPGMEVDRSKNEAIGLVGLWHGAASGGDLKGRKLVLNGHIDVVPE